MTQEEIVNLARKTAYELMVSPGTEMTVKEATDWWYNNDYNHPSIRLSQPFEHYECEGLRDIFEVLVNTLVGFAQEVQEN